MTGATRRRPGPSAFVGDWCLTGDLARIDGDGYYWFVGRDDDIITDRRATASARPRSRTA